MTSKQLKNNRKRVFDHLENDSMALFVSGYDQFKSADSVYPFVVNNNFYYLTGIDQQDVTLAIGKFNNEYFEYLFIDENDPVLVKWLGMKLTKEQASAICGVDVKNIYYNDKFNAFIDNHMQPLRYSLEVVKNLYLDLEVRNTTLYKTFATQFAKTMQKRYPAINIKNSYQLLVSLRMCKNASEIELMKDSIGTTKRAIENVMAHANLVNNESVAEAYYDFILTTEHKIPSFNSIIASGINGTTLHYEENNSDVLPNSLLLMDVGAYTNHYASDISRTFPLSGKFTQRQKEFYEIVLKCNKMCIDYAKAGMTWKELNDYAKKILAEGLIKLGKIKDESELNRYYFHSIGHSLGLDVHDPSIDNKGLLEGMVITIEPGLYIDDESIGIRIEDNILITKDKAILLSKDIIKEINDIEKFITLKTK